MRKEDFKELSEKIVNSDYSKNGIRFFLKNAKDTLEMECKSCVEGFFNNNLNLFFDFSNIELSENFSTNNILLDILRDIKYWNDSNDDPKKAIQKIRNTINNYIKEVNKKK